MVDRKITRKQFIQEILNLEWMAKVELWHSFDDGKTYIRPKNGWNSTEVKQWIEE